MKLDYVVMLTLKEALAVGIVHCKCGHPPNNHFLGQEGKPCAHCAPGKCKGYKQRFSRGKEIVFTPTTILDAMGYLAATTPEDPDWVDCKCGHPWLNHLVAAPHKCNDCKVCTGYERKNKD